MEAVFRIEGAKIVAVVARMLRDVGEAEEIAQDVMLEALGEWARNGVPANPGAWLMTAARHRAIDVLRRRKRLLGKHEELLREQGDEAYEVPRALELVELGDAAIEDDLLRLVFVACHPVLSQDARVALTLRLLGGLTTEEIARAFLVPEPTVAQRIVRAKKTLADANVPFEVPSADAREERLGSVLEVIYLVFNEGYSATAGDDWVRPTLCEDALRLGRVLAALMPNDSEVHGLVALMELQASRLRARVANDGSPVLLADQDRTLWERLLLSRGLAALDRAEALADARKGPYVLQAAIAACHARATSAAETDWARIAVLYEALANATRSPIVELNRAVALSMAFGPEAGLPIVDALCALPELARYHLLPAVRGDLLRKLGKRTEARREFEKAASLTKNARERALLLERAAECGSPLDG